MPRPLPLLLGALLALLAAAGCGGGNGGEAAPAPPPAETGAPAAEPPAPAEPEAQGDVEAGREIFASAGCGSCHTLEAAGSSGSIGPNLDDLEPGFEQTVEQVTNGGGGMPAYADTLSEQQILDVAAFVVESSAS